MIGMETATRTPASSRPFRSETKPGRPSRSTPVAASAATPSETHTWNRTGSRELPRIGSQCGVVEKESEFAQHQHEPIPINNTQKLDHRSRAALPPAPTTARTMAINPIYVFIS